MSTTTTETRSLGASGRQLSAVGVGTWALGARSLSMAATPGGARSTTPRVSARCTRRSMQESR
jgi:aryl-alcohol dehydrogenase-like predicted oxidoreductase